MMDHIFCQVVEMRSVFQRRLNLVWIMKLVCFLPEVKCIPP